MPRDLYQKVVAIRDPETDAFIALADVQITIKEVDTSLATIFEAPTGSTQGPRPSAGASGGPNPFLTGASGAVEFYANSPEAYDIEIEDTIAPPRLAPDSFRWNAQSNEDNSLPGAKLVDASVVGGKLTDETITNSDIAVTAGISGSKLASSTVAKDRLAAAVQEALFFPGDLKASAVSAPQAGWLLCDGSTVSRTGSTAALFAAIGTTYGVGNGTTTFNLPDLSGRVAVGVDGAAGRLSVNDSLGQSGGIEKHQLVLAELAAHTHSGPLHSHPTASGGGRGFATVVTDNSGSNAGIAPHGSLGNELNTGNAGNGATGSAGSGTAHQNMQPYQIVNWFIKM